MSYKLSFTQSPNYTPNAQTRALYGRPRTIEFGAGHWWDSPAANPSFAGTINTLMNPARQASAHAVVTAGEVRELVRAEDTSWCTGSANPYTVSIETDPRITTGGATAEAIMATLAEYIADKGWHNLTWRPHKYWMTTGCNPIDWGEVMRRAKVTWQAKYGQPAVKETSREVYNPLKKFTVAQDCILEFIPNGGNAGSRTYKKGEPIDIKQKLTMSDGSVWYRTQYSSDNELGTGFRAGNLAAVVEVPEWQRNMKPITPVNLMVLVPQTPIVNLNDLSVIKQLGQGTNVDFTHTTTVQGVEYLISSYSATNAMPNGIKRADVGVPAQPPVNEKPEWLKNWKDIEDVKMYARADTDLVDLTDGHTIKVIARGTEIAVASVTEWHGGKYAITEYSTGKQLGQGIRIDDLDMKPITNPDVPVEPAPEQPDLTPDTNAIKAFLQMLVDLITAFLAKFKK
jgi:hypothetical protein